MESKELSWAWVTADRLLSHGPAEIHCALMVPSGGGTSTADIYDGEDTKGDKVVGLRTAQSNAAPFSPKEPVYCRRGIYVDCKAIVLGVFVQWRELGSKG